MAQLDCIVRHLTSIRSFSSRISSEVLPIDDKHETPRTCKKDMIYSMVSLRIPQIPQLLFLSVCSVFYGLVAEILSTETSSRVRTTVLMRLHECPISDEENMNILRFS